MSSTFRAFVVSSLLLGVTPIAHAQLSHPIFPKPTFGTGTQPRTLAAGDINGDGRPDLVVGRTGPSSSGGSFQVLRNLDGITFTPPSNDHFTLYGPGAFAIGDIDGDDDGDVIVACNYIAVFRNFGGGTFSPALFLGTGPGAASLALADLDHDGDLDLVAAYAPPGNGFVFVFANDGTGNFTVTGNYPAGAAPWSIAIGDLDGDGDLDIAAANANDNTVSVLLNQGDGFFVPAVWYPAGSDPVSITIGDFDGDGDLDLAVANVPSNGVTVLLNDGSGSFASRRTFAAGDTPRFVKAVDVDSDGDLDLIVHGFYVVVLGNDGTGSFAAPVEYPLGSWADGIAVADFDGDGHVDIVAARNSTDAIELARNDGTGHFQMPDLYSPPTPGSVAIADFDGDGDLDLAAMGSAVLTIEKNDGHGHLAASATIPFNGNPQMIVSGDIDGDGDVDLVVTNAVASAAFTFVNAGDGTFTPGPNVPVGASPKSLALADLDADGDLDMIVANAVSAGTIRIFKNNGDGSFSASVVLNAGNTPHSLGIADFDGDGDLDLVVLNTIGQSWSFLVYANNGDATFAAPHSFMLPNYPSELAVGDLNADGSPDLVIFLSGTVSGAERVAMLTNVGGGQSFNPVYFSTGKSGGHVALSDWNGDGRLDVIASSVTGAWLLANNGDGSFTANGRYYTFDPLYFLGSADLNGDGRPDLVCAGVDFFGHSLAVSFNYGPLSPFFRFCYGDGELDVPCPCGNDGISGHGCENSATTGGARLGAEGITDPDSVVLTSTGELPSVLSIALQSDHTRTPVAFGDGLRCVNGSLLRLYTKNASAGTVSMPQAGDPSISARSAALGDPIAPGSKRFYQVYYRDNVLGFCPSPGNGWNVSNAVAIQW